MGNRFSKKNKNKNTNWTQLRACNTHSESILLTTNPIIVNNNEFVIAPWAYNKEQTKKNEEFYKYNIQKNKWSVYQQYPQSFTFDKQVLWFHIDKFTKLKNKKINKIYIKNESILSIIDYNTKMNEFKNTNINILPYTFIQVITINNTLHVFGGTDVIKHITADLNGDNMKTIFEFDENISSFDSIIYLKSKQEIYAFGGSLKGGGYNFSCDIWKHTLGSNEWIKFDFYKFRLPRQMYSVGSVVTFDEKYILFFGGSQSWHNGEDVVPHDNIFILDLMTMKFRKSVIVCPYRSDSYFPIIIKSYKDELLLYGYLRKIKIIPIQIWKYILLFFDYDQYVHLLNYQSCSIRSIKPIQHYRIPLHKLLNYTDTNYP